MKKMMVRMLCIFCILLLCSACGRVAIRDEFEAETLTEEIARSIVLFYNSAPPVSEFTEDTAIPYERAFLYFSYAGLYNADDSLRKAVEPYRQGRQSIHR